MRYEEDLQLKVRERYRRLLTSNYTAWGTTLKVTRDWILGQRPLTLLLTEAARAEPDLDPPTWVSETIGNQGFSDWPHTTEDGQATLCWAIMNQWAEEVDPRQAAMMLSGATNINDSVRETTENYLQPLFDYLSERVGDTSSVLHIMDRYVRVIEWFDRDALAASYDLDTVHGEEIYNRHLRRFLFSEGLDMPYTEAASPSGDSDALSNLETDDPLVCELKLFDNVNKGKRHVASGVHQAVQYAHDYGKDTAYLVIVNLSGRALNLPTDADSKTWPPVLDVGGVRIYMINARGNRRASASKLGKTDPITWTREDLIDLD
jgi:hypothetical protein